MSASSSRVSSAGSNYSSRTRTAYKEISRKRSFLDGLGELPRPQATIEDAQFLTYYSLKAQKLTLSDILSHCSLNSVEPLEEFPNKFSSAASSAVLFHKVNAETRGTGSHSSTAYSPRLHLNNKLLSAKQQQLCSLIHLYESEIQWLSIGSRLWFGPIRGRHVALLADFSDSISFSDVYSHYLAALHVAVEEQLAAMDKVYVFGIGTEASDPVIFDMRYNTSAQVSAAKKWFTDVRAQGSCNLMQGVKKVMKLMPDIDTIAILLCSKPNQKLSIIHDYLVQLLIGRENLPNFHIVAINLDEDMRVTLGNIVQDLNGHYHQLSFSKEGEPLMEDALINEITNELLNAREVFKQLENVKNNIYDEFLLETLRQLSVVSEWPTDDTFSPPNSPTHHSVLSMPLNSTEWIKRKGIDSLGHNLYQFLAPDAYSQLTEYVSLIDKSALSSVYDLVMPQFLWHDGTYKYLHVDTARLSGYVNDMKVHAELFKKRMNWLTSGSRMPFGNIEEKRAIIMIDTSLICGLHLTQLQQHLKILLHEQINKLDSFNIVSISDVCEQWSDQLEPPTKESLAEAWKWILHINPKGMCSLLESLHHVLESPAYDDDIMARDPIGLYVIISSMPNQTESLARSYLEQVLSGRRISLHVVFYQPLIPDRWARVTLIKGAGRHGDTQSIEKYLKHLSNDLGSYHQFTVGELVESSDYQILQREQERANFYLDSAEHILDDYKSYYCKRTVRAVQVEEVGSPEKQQQQRPCSAPPTYPRPTLASVARLNSTFTKLKERESDNVFSSHMRKPRKKGPFLTCHCFYLGRGLKKGLYYELMESGICSQCKKSLIPLGEESISTSEWLGKYGLRQLKLYSKGLFTSRKDGYKHMTTDGRVAELSISHKELGKLWKLFNAVRARYTDRLQWLLTDSRYVFGCITGRKVVILIDVSSSMKVHQLNLKDQLKTLLKEQLARKRISFFNIVAFATDVTSWQTSLVPNTARHRSEAQEWIQKLRFGGCSNLDEAITCSLKQKGQEIYLISDGDTDHTSSYLMSQVKELKKTFPFNWHINSIAYQTTRNESLCFLQTIAKETKGRYHFYSSERQLDKPTVLEKSKALYLERQLGDDVKGLADEIALADYSIKQSLYYLGRYS